MGLHPDPGPASPVGDYQDLPPDRENILKEHGLDPGPERGKGTWDEFLSSHAQTLWQYNFATKRMWTYRGFVDVTFLVFLHLGISSDDGEAVAILMNDAPVACILAWVKGGYSRELINDGPWGHPWSDEVYLTTFKTL